MLTWPFGSLGLVTLALVLFLAPSRLEGHVLVPISPGHALSLMDAIALLPLLTGMTWLYHGFWQRRERLYNAIRQSPAASSAAIFTTGFGLGLLIASSFSSFFWWWVIGSALFGTMVIAAVAAMRRA